jgi:dTDP-4-dehydrorhamnose 3,5-epimerase-like enzyme
VKARQLAVPGAWEITPQLHTDARGVFFEWFTDAAFTEFAGHRLDVRQANCSVYLSEGLGHAFLALEDNSTVMYLCSAGYAPGREHTINPLDPTLDITWPDTDGEPILSDRDREAPTLAQAQAAGLLPTWNQTQAFIDDLRRG